MKRNLIIEGMDGSGKSSLITRLRKDFPKLPEPSLASTHDGPVPNLTNWIITDDTIRLVRGAKRLYDRHPLISDPIYRSIIKPDLPPRWTASWRRSRLSTLLYDAVVVYCDPGIATIERNLRLSKDRQMLGVLANARPLYLAYSYFMTSIEVSSDVKVILAYDYTTPFPYDIVRQIVEKWVI